MVGTQLKKYKQIVYSIDQFFLIKTQLKIPKFMRDLET